MKHIEIGVRLVLAMMRSASTDKIKPVEWWQRAKTALETGAAVASDLPEMVSAMGRKLQIDVTTQATANAICSIAAEIDDFEAFRRTCEQQALYIVAFAQGRREDEREAQRTADEKADIWRAEVVK